MLVNGQAMSSIELKEDSGFKFIQIIDQRFLPHELIFETLKTVQEVGIAIKDMHLRGAPLIGGVAAFGAYFAAIEADENHFAAEYKKSCDYLISTRPTAINLQWAVETVSSAIANQVTKQEKIEKAWEVACKIIEDDTAQCKAIGEHFLPVIEAIAARKKEGEPVNILTHCNAGWLACIDYGTATSPMYQAHDKGIKIHVWVDETRPRNQGAKLTAWELGQHGIDHTVIADNTGGHLMQHGMVDLVITGTDRTTVNGDVANKIGTYLKALAANDNNVPFYVALPSSTFDWECENGMDIEIETRDEKEVTHMDGKNTAGKQDEVLITPTSSNAINYGFDVTPARLVTGLISERGICKASKESILEMYPEKA